MKTYAQITGYWTSNPDELFTDIVCLNEWENEDDTDVLFYMDGEALITGDRLDLNVQGDNYIVKTINEVFTK